MHRANSLLVASLLLLAILMLSGIRPYDRPTWALEVFPVMLVLPILWATYWRFPLTNLLYALIFAHSMVLIVGGMYTYARVPFGFELAEWLELERNPYDKIGHLFQGFVPALAAREILVRGHYVNGRRMLAFIILCIVLAVSAVYELIEWLAAIAFGQGAYEFLGTQGDPWDTQSDMLLALIGGVAALALLSGVHDRQMQRLERSIHDVNRPATP